MLFNVIKLIYYFFEGFIFTKVSFAYLGLKLVMKRLMIYTVFYGVFVFVLREILCGDLIKGKGIHTVIFLFINTILLIIFLKPKIIVAFISNLLHLLTVFLIEILVFIPLSLMRVTPEVVTKNQLLFSLMLFTNIAMGLLLDYVITKTKFKLFPIEKIIS